MTRPRREIEVVRCKERQESQTRWKDKCVVRRGSRGSEMEEEAKISDGGQRHRWMMRDKEKA